MKDTYWIKTHHFRVCRTYRG